MGGEETQGFSNANSGAPGQWKVSDGTVAKPVGEAKSPSDGSALRRVPGTGGFSRKGETTSRAFIKHQGLVAGSICFIFFIMDGYQHLFF